MLRFLPGHAPFRPLSPRTRGEQVGDLRLHLRELLRCAGRLRVCWIHALDTLGRLVVTGEASVMRGGLLLTCRRRLSFGTEELRQKELAYLLRRRRFRQCVRLSRYTTRGRPRDVGPRLIRGEALQPA
jgi:hypothetical protein